MKIIPLTRGLETCVDDEDFEYLNQWVWFAKSAGHGTEKFYAARYGQPSLIFMHQAIFEHQQIFGQADHEDRDGLNNQRYNLRVATQTQNMQNRGVRKDNTSGFKGVNFDVRSGKWKARIALERRRINLGAFETKADAARAYNKASRRFHGVFGYQNLIPTEA